MTAVLEQETIDMAAAHSLVMQMLKDGQATMLGVLSAVGDRLGLFESLATYGPIGSDSFAARSGIDARYAREWLSAMACQGYITYDARDDAFWMSPEQRLCLVDATSPLNLAGGFAIWPVYWNNLEELTQVFRDAVASHRSALVRTGVVASSASPPLDTALSWVRPGSPPCRRLPLASRPVGAQQMLGAAMVRR